MDYNFGDISLFHAAISEDRLHPPIDAYLVSVGLSSSEIEDVKAMFYRFCVAIDNAEVTPLPDIATGPVDTSRFQSSVSS